MTGLFLSFLQTMKPYEDKGPEEFGSQCYEDLLATAVLNKVLLFQLLLLLFNLQCSRRYYFSQKKQKSGQTLTNMLFHKYLLIIMLFLPTCYPTNIYYILLFIAPLGRHHLVNCFLTHYSPRPFSRQVLRYSLRLALIVYRLIGAMLIRHFFHDPFFLNEILTIREQMLPLGNNGLRWWAFSALIPIVHCCCWCGHLVNRLLWYLLPFFFAIGV